MNIIYNNGQFVDENGKTYKLSDDSVYSVPTFGQNDEGDLLYSNNPPDEYEFRITENGELEINGDLEIEDDGDIYGEQSWEFVADSQDADMQRNIELLRSHNKTIKMHVTLYNDNYEVIGDLIGNIQSIDFDRTNSSLIRNTCSLTLSIPIKEQLELDIENTWNHRMVELKVGILDNTIQLSDQVRDQYRWYKLGRMLLVSGSTKFDATTQEVKLNLADLMASLAQERGNQIGVEIFIPPYTYTEEEPTPIPVLVKDVIIATIGTFAQFQQYSITGLETEAVPYDITVSTGGYPIDILQSLLDLFPQYEMFYDADGVFTVRPIPTKINDPIDIDYNILDDVLISESKTVDFADIKNTTEVWGRELTAGYSATSCTQTSGSYHVVIDETTFTELVSGDTYMIVPDANSINNQKMKIQDLPEYQIYIEQYGEDSENNETTMVYIPITSGEMLADVPYVVKYFEQRFILQGELQIRCIVQEITTEPSRAAKDYYKAQNECNNVKWIINPTSPYACNVTGTTGRIDGEMRQVLSGGEYDNIYTTQLAYDRAEYENWLRCRMQDTIEIETILIPWVEINDKIRYTSPVSGQKVTWLVQDISYDFTNWTMTVKASRFYPYYPWD